MRPQSTSQKRDRAQRQEGAAMLVVTLMLLIGTTIAAMTVHALSLEIRSAGYYRQQAQTHYVAEAALQGVLSLEPAILVQLLHTNDVPPIAFASPVVTDMASIINYDEPDPALVPGLLPAPAGGKRVFRMPKHLLDSHLVADPGGGQPVQEGVGQSLGQQAFAPWYVIDFSDYHYEEQAVAGEDASGNSPQEYANATVTVRGRTLLDNGAGQPAAAALRGASTTVAGDRLQRFTDGAYDMRVVARFGPVPK